MAASTSAQKVEITTEAELDPLRILNCPDDDALGAARSELQSWSVPLGGG